MVQSTLTLAPRCSVVPGPKHPHQRSLRGLPPEFIVPGRATPPATATGPKDYDIRRARARFTCRQRSPTPHPHGRRSSLPSKRGRRSARCRSVARPRKTLGLSPRTTVTTISSFSLAGAYECELCVWLGNGIQISEHSARVAAAIDELTDWGDSRNDGIGMDRACVLCCALTPVSCM